MSTSRRPRDGDLSAAPIPDTIEGSVTLRSLRRPLALAGLTLLLAAGVEGSQRPPCSEYARAATRTGRTPKALRELSGIAASHRHPGVYWAHNDSNNEGTLFAIDERGEVLARYVLRGLRPRDAEDVALGPCAPGSQESCIFLADIGDNLARRREVWIGRLPEPRSLDDGTLVLEADSFRYPDGPRNAESLLVDPRSGALYVITKTVHGLGDVFRLDGLGSPGGGRAVPVARLPAPATLARLTTAADAHRSGEHVLLRTYAGVWELRRPGAASLEEVFAAKPVAITGAPQLQAEGATYTTDREGYLLASEEESSPIYRVDCAEER